MRERRYVKFKLDIYDDTKTNIIDQKPERDFIHYFFARSIILAGKSDCEGELYMGKDIPYTIETLATEFGRDAALIKVALDLLIELKMIEVTEGNIYRVKSFAKHQNIKVKEKVKVEEENEAEDEVLDVIGEGNNIIENKVSKEEEENKEYTGKNAGYYNEVNKIEEVSLLNYNLLNSTDGGNKYNDEINQDAENKEIDISQHNNSPVILQMKKNQKANRKNNKLNKKKISDEIIETNEDSFQENINNIENENDICVWSDIEVPLQKEEKLMAKWAF